MPSEREIRSAARVCEVWVGLIVYPPDHPPRHPKIERVFADEDAALAWSLEGAAPTRAMTTMYRRVERHEVVHAN